MPTGVGRTVLAANMAIHIAVTIAECGILATKFTKNPSWVYF